MFVHQRPLRSLGATPGRNGNPTRQIRFDTPSFVEPKTSTLNFAAFGLFYMFVFAIPWENALLLPGVGTVSRLLGLLALPVAALAILERGRLRSPSLPLMLMGLFMVWGSLSYLWTVNAE